MDNSSLHVTQTDVLTVLLDPSGLHMDIEAVIKRELNRCYLNRFLPKYGVINLIRLISIGEPYIKGGIDASVFSVDCTVSIKSTVPRVGAKIVAKILVMHDTSLILAQCGHIVVRLMDSLFSSELESEKSIIRDMKTLQAGDLVNCSIQNFSVAEGNKIIILGKYLNKVDQTTLTSLNFSRSLELEVADRVNVSTEPPIRKEEYGWLDMAEETSEIIDLMKKVKVTEDLNMFKLIAYTLNPLEMVSNQSYAGRGPSAAFIGSIVSKKIVISRSYYKIWELIERFGEMFGMFDLESLKVLCLSDAPGGFTHGIYSWWNERVGDDIHIYSLARKKHEEGDSYSVVDWSNMTSTQANILDEMVKSGKVTIDEDYLADKTGILDSVENLDYLRNEILENEKVDMVTIDGAVYTDDKNEYEIENHNYLFGELIAMMNNLKDGGYAVIKMYSITTDGSVDVVVLLNDIFEEVKVVKPDFSRIGTNERYLICSGYKGVPSYIDDLMAVFLGWTEEWKRNRLEGEKIWLGRLFSTAIEDEVVDIIRSQESFFSSSITGFYNEAIATYKRELIVDEVWRKNVKERQIKLAIEWCKKMGIEHREVVAPVVRLQGEKWKTSIEEGEQTKIIRKSKGKVSRSVRAAMYELVPPSDKE